MDIDLIDRAAALVAGGSRVVALTGAGVSTASGIADFRGPEGLWTRDPAAERLSSIDAYLDDPEVRRAAWHQRASDDPRGTRPNPAHEAFVRMERLGRLELLVTQNVDGLHLDAGTARDRLVEIHGTARQVDCLDCGDRQPMTVVLDRVRAGEADPACQRCGGMLKAATVSFGQALDPGLLRRAANASSDCEVFIAAGTSLTVHPVAGLPELAVRAGAALIVINAEPTPFDHVADVVLRDDVGVAMTAIVDRVTALVDAA